MRKIYSLMMMLAMMVAALSFNACSSSDDDGDGIDVKMDYDVLQVNGVSYACYGYRCFVTYESTWDLMVRFSCLLMRINKRILHNIWG